MPVGWVVSTGLTRIMNLIEFDMNNITIFSSIQGGTLVVDLYIHTNIKGPAVRTEGTYLWLLTYEAKNKQIVTLNGWGQLKNTNELRLSLIAICRALRRMRLLSDINIYTDCGSLRTYYAYLDSWAKSDWKKGYLKHKELWSEIYARTDRQQVNLYPLEGTEYANWMDWEIKKLCGRENV